MSAPCTLLTWDSDFFGVRVARVNEARLTADSAHAVDAWCAAQNIACLYFLADASDTVTHRTAESHGYHLVDVRLTFTRGMSVRLPDVPHTVTIRPHQSDDVPRLRMIARDSYTDSRYYHDPCFPRAQADALYETWISNSCAGYADAVLVAEHDGLISGFISCHLRDTSERDGQVGEIGLVGVAQESRGQQVGGQLVYAALDWFNARGAARVQVVTQARNIAAQRLYQRAGFLSDSIAYWYHKWFTACP